MRSTKRGRLPLAILLASLSGCAGAVSSVCPRPVEYSDAFQDRLAVELEALPNGSALGQAMIDYGSERAQLRACVK